ncbi:MAG: hypothetical protein OXJ52_03525 [Oligoflexia bacterium]|nr:hypothetical protein [Oligoflexia bacterium]
MMNYPSLSFPVSKVREQILNDISLKENYIKSWYCEKKWTKNDFDFSTIATDTQGNSIAISSCKLMPDKTLKILCHFYVMRKMRSIYPSISHTDFTPHYVKYAKEHSLKGVWFSVHCFNDRQKRHKKAVIRSLNGGLQDLKFQPYACLFKYEGEIQYNSVTQSKFLYLINEGE